MILLKKINNSIKGFVFSRKENTLQWGLIGLSIFAIWALSDIEEKTKIANISLIGLVGVGILLIYGLSIKGKSFKKLIDKYALKTIAIFIIILFSNAASSNDFRLIILSVLLVIIGYKMPDILGFLTQYYPFSLFFQDQYFHARHKSIKHSYETAKNIIDETCPDINIFRIFHTNDHVHLFYKMKRGRSLSVAQEKELIDKLSEEFGYATITDTKEGRRILVPKIED